MAPVRSAKGSKKSNASETSGRKTVNRENAPQNTPPPANTKAPASKQSLSERNKALEKKLEETTGLYHCSVVPVPSSSLLMASLDAHKMVAQHDWNKN